MPKLTKEQAINIANDLMEKYSSNQPYRFGTARYEDKGSEAYWYVMFVLLDDNSNTILREPSSDIIHVFDETGEAYFYANF